MSYITEHNNPLSHLAQLISKSAQPGRVTHWGLPLGQWGRVFPLLFLREHKGLTLWINAHGSLRVYPPTWASFGVALDRIRFLHHSHPFELKPLFFNNTFDLVIIDSPQSFKPSEWAFLNSRARILRQTVFVLQNYWLSPRLGNVFAHQRINVGLNFNERVFWVQGLKGQHTPKLHLPFQEIWHALIQRTPLTSPQSPTHTTQLSGSQNASQA